jgi:ERCC4-type nuclease
MSLELNILCLEEPGMIPEIAVDCYEPAYFFDELKKSGHTTDNLRMQLPTGDYVWSGTQGQSIGIERKEVSDLLSSFGNGRLTDQLSRLIDQYTWPILLVEGYLGMNPDGSVKILSAKGGFHSRQFRYTTVVEILLEAQLAGAFVVPSANKYSTLHLIRSLYVLSQKTDHALLNKRSRPFQLGTRVDEQTFLVMGLPGFGEKASRQLLSRFGTPFGVFGSILMDAKGVLAVPGIGMQKLKRAQKVLTGSSAEAKDNESQS